MTLNEFDLTDYEKQCIMEICRNTGKSVTHVVRDSIRNYLFDMGFIDWDGSNDPK